MNFIIRNREQIWLCIEKFTTKFLPVIDFLIAKVNTSGDIRTNVGKLHRVSIYQFVTGVIFTLITLLRGLTYQSTSLSLRNIWQFTSYHITEQILQTKIF